MIRKINRKKVYDNTIKLAGGERMELGSFLKRADRLGDLRRSLQADYSRNRRITLKSNLIEYVNNLIQEAYDTGVGDKEGGVA